MKFHTIFIVFALMPAVVSCRQKDNPDEKAQTTEEAGERSVINFFGYNVMNTYYLWNKEIEPALKAWDFNEDPIEKVKAIRYKDSSGKDIDKWTTMTDDIDELVGTTNGVATTYGMDFKLYYIDESKTGICLVTTVVFSDSPAAKAGIKRGDVFFKINGKGLNINNYRDMVYDGFLYAPSTSLEDKEGRTYSLKAVEMYEDPILAEKVLDIDGHKVGYLAYYRFTLRSISDLAAVGRRFREAGIEEVILDMRYNPGGYVLTETALASLLVPEEQVKSEGVFHTNIYNSTLTEAWGKSETKFASTYTYSDGGQNYTVDISDANFGVSKVYAILTEDSASASEGVLVGIMPYVDVKILGKQSHGKYCSGIMYSAKDFFSDVADQLTDEAVEAGNKYSKKWGIYVMVSRYADLNGNTPCMPDGFIPDVDVSDNPVDPTALGDEREPILAAVISYIKGEAATKAPASMTVSMPLVPDQPRDPMFGASILRPEDLPLLH